MNRSVGLIFCILSSLISMGQSPLEKADHFFSQRAKGSKATIAKKKFINKAIRWYSMDKEDPESIAGLLRSYEFKGSYTGLSSKNQKKVYLKALDEGKRALESYPEHIGIRYYYMTNLGRWGEIMGVVNAAKEGISEEIRDLAVMIIESDPDFAESGAQRILGILHLRVPSIPFVLSWPSEDRAEELLTEAYQRNSSNPANARFYAEMLVKKDRKEEAMKVLQDAENQPPRDHMVIEDRINLERISNYKREIFE